MAIAAKAKTKIARDKYLSTVSRFMAFSCRSQQPIPEWVFIDDKLTFGANIL
jgi:hypothetical protein